MEPTSWANREGLLLRAIIDRLDAEGPGVDPRRVADAIGMSHADADRASRRLHDAKMLRAMAGDDRVMSVREVTEKGLQAAGEWPASTEQAAQALLAALDDAIDNAPDPEERSRLQTLRSAAGNVSINALGGIGAAAFFKLMGWA